MIKKFWTITQKEEIEKCCSEYEIPQDITSEMFRIIHILDENYGVDRALESDGGYVALLVEENYSDDYEKILKEHNLKKSYAEFQDIFPVTEKTEWCSDLYIVTNDYGITIMYPHDIVNIGLHFFLKNVRPYAASCSEA